MQFRQRLQLKTCQLVSRRQETDTLIDWLIVRKKCITPKTHVKPINFEGGAGKTIKLRNAEGEKKLTEYGTAGGGW